MKTANHRLIGNLISARSFIGKVTEKAGPRAAMAALGPAFRPVLALVTGDEVHPQSSVARITQDQTKCCQQMTPPAVFCEERSPGHTTTVFRSWLGACPFQYRSVYSASAPNDAAAAVKQPNRQPIEKTVGRYLSNMHFSSLAGGSSSKPRRGSLTMLPKGPEIHLLDSSRTGRCRRQPTPCEIVVTMTQPNCIQRVENY